MTTATLSRHPTAGCSRWCRSSERKERPREVASDKDITAEIKKTLPKELSEKLVDVEKVLGKDVIFLEVGQVIGGAQGGANSDGTIRLLPTTKADMGVVGEEVMHLHRWTSGFPRMEPLQPAMDGRYANRIRQLSGHFEEYFFFPFLQDLKLNPRAAVDAAMPRLLRDLTLLHPDIERDGETDAWRVTLPTMYAQAALLTSGTTGSKVIDAFEVSKVLAPYSKLGILVCDEIVAAQNKDVAGLKEHMERVLFTHLRLKSDAVEVKPVFSIGEPTGGG